MNRMIKLTYDKSADTAYIYLDNIQPGEVAKTYPCDPTEVDGMINLDFKKNGVLVGIEIIGASKKLTKEFLANAEIIKE